ncbi:MAG: hypothetical protein M1833_002846 [Piccolia ochrophora]|nr:MAG: hypothetical protein M1833_002846 [Piccolia ochrophora]
MHIFSNLSAAVALALATSSLASHHQGHVHRRNDNETVSLTTSTLYSTQVYTVTSCAPTVTDCPEGPHVETKTIAIGTTVCPVSEAAKPSKPADAEAAPSSAPYPVENSTLTYTLGTGISTTVVTTIVHKTKTNSHETTVTTGPASPESTVESTRTSTKVVTVYAKSSSPLVDAKKADKTPSGSDACPAPSTVTLTEKVTVTVSAHPTSSSGPVSPEETSIESSSAPYHNGTETTKTKCTKCVASTGFITILSTGAVHPTGHKKHE